MNNSKYPLATSTWDHSELEAMQDVIQSGKYTMGDKVLAYERAFAEYHQSRFSVMVNSGSSANLLMVAALFFRSSGALEPGDEVIVPAVSWSTTYTPLQQYGLKLKFVDIDLFSLNMDVNLLKKAITPKTKLVMSVNLLGNPNDYNSILEILSKKGITLIEDNCESLGAELQGKKTGTFGLMGTFSSFFPITFPPWKVG